MDILEKDLVKLETLIKDIQNKLAPEFCVTSMSERLTDYNTRFVRNVKNSMTDKVSIKKYLKNLFQYAYLDVPVDLYKIKNPEIHSHSKRMEKFVSLLRREKIGCILHLNRKNEEVSDEDFTFWCLPVTVDFTFKKVIPFVRLFNLNHSELEIILTFNPNYDVTDNIFLFDEIRDGIYNYLSKNVNWDYEYVNKKVDELQKAVLKKLSRTQYFGYNWKGWDKTL